MKRVLLVVGACAAAGLIWLLLGRGEEPRSTRAARPPVASPVVAAETVLEVAPTRSLRTELPSTVHPAAGTDADRAEVEATASVRVCGRVLDRGGVGQPGVRVVKVGGFFGGTPGSGTGKEIAISGAGGSFEAELVLGENGDVLESGRDSGFATLRAARVTRENSAGEQLLVVAPAIQLAGTVAEASGSPLAGARLRFEVPLAALVGFPAVLDGTVETAFEAVTGEKGRFAFLRVPSSAGARLFVQRTGFRSLERAAPSESQDDLWLELEPQGEKDPWLQGVVVHADGRPAQGAKVRLDELATKTDADGRFGLQQEWASEEAPLVAALPGFQPALLPSSGALMQQDLPPPFVRLVLGGPTLAIQGKILDAEGKPCRGWQVNLRDGTVLTPGQVPFDLAEDLARGKKVATKSDKQGAFELEGLLARDYVVQAYDLESLLMLRSDPVAAGTLDLVLRVPADAVLERLAGVVVARDGTPLAGVRVETRLVTAEYGGGMSWDHGMGATTDSAGRFELEQVPRRHVSLQVEGESVIPEAFGLERVHAGGEERFEVARRCHLRVEFGSVPRATESQTPDSIPALDFVGKRLQLHLFQGNGWRSSSSVHLTDLGSNTLAVSEDARTLVFYRDHAELRRVPLTLVPGEVVVVRAGGQAR